MSERNLQDLHNRLTKAFIQYQWNLDYPFPHAVDNTQDSKFAKYHTDPIFHAKVATIVAGVSHIVTNWLED